MIAAVPLAELITHEDGAPATCANPECPRPRDRGAGGYCYACWRLMRDLGDLLGRSVPGARARLVMAAIDLGNADTDDDLAYQGALNALFSAHELLSEAEWRAGAGARAANERKAVAP